MKVWRCEVFADVELTLPCVIFIGRFESCEEATGVLTAELAAVQVLLYPGEMAEMLDSDVQFEKGQQFRMTRYSAA